MTDAEMFNILRSLCGSLTQEQVNAGNEILKTTTTKTVAEFLGYVESDGTYLITETDLQNIYPGADNKFVDIINKYSKKFEITTKKRMAMFLAHAIHESRGFNVLKESFNYRPDRLKAVFPTRIPTLNFATNLINKGQAAIANHLYNGRYGNNNINDGWLYSGKGIGQLTFKANYINIQNILKSMKIDTVDIVANPMSLVEPDTATLTYMAYWKSRNINTHADKSDVRQCTILINGGLNGYGDRVALFNKAMKVLK